MTLIRKVAAAWSVPEVFELIQKLLEIDYSTNEKGGMSVACWATIVTL